jgi:tRNA (guanine-N7-)-methyltransferase
MTNDQESCVSAVSGHSLQNVNDVALSLPPPPPWNAPTVPLRVATKRRNNNARFRQHVNPLARSYQRPTLLPDNWPTCVYDDLSKPLHLDIGCGKGGFLIDLCLERERKQTIEADTAGTILPVDCNYLGLEIRPGVAAYAKDRIATHQLQGRLDFLGCNANVDLERLLDVYRQQHLRCCVDTTARNGQELTTTAAVTTTTAVLQCVTIQFPDPHFKTQHAKRRVVTPQLIDTLAEYMPTGSTVFLQSDVQGKFWLLVDGMNE